VHPLRRATSPVIAGLGAALLLLGLLPATASSATTPVSAPSAGTSAGLSIPGGGGTPNAGAANASGNAVTTGRANTRASTPTPAARAQVAAAVPAGYPVRGIDVSGYQPTVNWASVAAAGDHFAYVKATEGTSYTNPYFSSQYGGAKAAGLYAGAYAFARPDANNPVQQAQYFLSQAGFVRDGKTLPPMLDLEEPYSGSGVTNMCWGLQPPAMVAWIHAFVSTVEAVTAQPILIYTNPNWWDPCTDSSTAFGGQLLNIPNWNTPLTSPTNLPTGWSKWTFWQYADSGSQPGDQDVFSGNLSQLAVLAKPAVAPGTSPSVAGLRTGGYEIAYQSVNGTLVTIGTAGYRSWGLGMMAGTSPDIAALKGGGFEVVFQANTGKLWTVGTRAVGTTLGMKAGTSPSIAALVNGGYEVAFQAVTGELWTKGAINHGAWGVGMMAGTSPSITGLADGTYEVVFQANTGKLWTVGTRAVGTTLGMMAGTSPSVAGLAKGGYEVAFQANNGALWTKGAINHGAWGLGIKAGTSPNIAALRNGSYEVAFQANTGSLWTVGYLNHGAWNLGMMAGTSPDIALMTNNHYEAAFQANVGALWASTG
jgi:GH25 family lysozyme M1 (1,4-beta-N-acetylmuramidase)